MTHAPLGSIMYLHVAGWNTGLHIPVYNPSPTTTTLDQDVVGNSRKACREESRR